MGDVDGPSNESGRGQIERADPDPGDSAIQRDAEPEIVAAVGKQLGADLAPTRISLDQGAHVEIDGFSDDPPILCEAWAHQGPPRGAQYKKVLADAFKLAFVGGLRRPRPRLVLAFSDPEAAKPFEGRSWYAQALQQWDIEVFVVEISNDLRLRILQAQERQYR